MFAAMVQISSRNDQILRLFGFVSIAAVGLVALACGGAPPPPKRGVVEHDVSSWKFRRYQEMQEVEVWVADNSAVAHTASYVRARAEKEGRIGDGDILNAFVTRYQSERGVLRATVVFVRRLAQESGYQIEEDKRAGVRLFTIAGHDESWVMWPSRGHVVKLGGRYVDAVPDAIIDAYGERYPSTLQNGMLDGPLPEVEPGPAKGDGKPAYNPENPAPDWKKYNSGDVDKKIDDKKGDGD